MLPQQSPARRQIADRLCRLALAKTYGRAVEYSGPRIEKVEGVGGALRLTFSHAEHGLTDRGAPLNNFEVAGADGAFFAATAHIDGNTIFVSSPDVAVPVVVRYAWSAAPRDCNLYNAEGLPAAPFVAQVK